MPAIKPENQKVALFASAFYPSVGGVQEVVRNLAHEQRALGQSPLIVTNRWPKDLPASEDYEGLPVRRFIFRVPEHTPKQRIGAFLSGPGVEQGVCAALRAAGTELIHIHCVSSNAYYALKAKRRLGLPLVVSLHGELSMDAGGLFQKSRFAQNLLRDTLREADGITGCSAQTLAEAEAFFGEPFGPRARVVYSGVRLSDFQGVTPHRHPRPYILAIGRLVPQKGFDVLLEAFAQAVTQGETSHDLLLAGEGAEEDALKALAGTLGISERVHFLGRAPRAEAVRLFAGCSFFALPSRVEPMGIVNLEAMACGKAVVASRVGGVPELVQEDRTGLLVSGADAEALAAALIRLMRDSALRERLGAAGREQVKQFDWPAIAAQQNAVYEYVADRRQGSLVTA